MPRDVRRALEVPLLVTDLSGDPGDLTQLCASFLTLRHAGKIAVSKHMGEGRVQDVLHVHLITIEISIVWRCDGQIQAESYGPCQVQT